MADALLLSPPDDLRYAITTLQEIQSVKDTFQKDVAEFRRMLLIQPKGPMEVTFTFRTGLQCTIGADASYGKVRSIYGAVFESFLTRPFCLTGTRFSVYFEGATQRYQRRLGVAYIVTVAYERHVLSTLAASAGPRHSTGPVNSNAHGQ